MSILLDSGEIQYPRLCSIKDEGKIFRFSVSAVLKPDDPNYVSQIVWLPPKDQERAMEYFRKVQVIRLIRLLEKLLIL